MQSKIRVMIMNIKKTIFVNNEYGIIEHFFARKFKNEN